MFEDNAHAKGQAPASTPQRCGEPAQLCNSLLQGKNYLPKTLKGYLQGRGLPLNKPFRCLSPAHEDKHPSMSYNARIDKVHCFACGNTYDLVDLLVIDGVPMHEAIDIKRGRERKKSHEVMGNSQYRTQNPAQEPNNTKNDNNNSFSGAPITYSNAMNYWQLRGITKATCERFGLVVKGWFAEIPFGDGYVQRRSLQGKGYFNPKGEKSRLFDPEHANGLVVVVEGAIDAVSVLQAAAGLPEGGVRLSALALNSVSNLAMVADHAKANPGSIYCLALDNDKAGMDAARRIADMLDSQGTFYFYGAEIYGVHKDANEALCSDSEGFVKALEGLMQEYERRAHFVPNVQQKQQLQQEYRELKEQHVQEVSVAQNSNEVEDVQMVHEVQVVQNTPQTVKPQAAETKPSKSSKATIFGKILTKSFSESSAIGWDVYEKVFFNGVNQTAETQEFERDEKSECIVHDVPPVHSEQDEPNTHIAHDAHEMRDEQDAVVVSDVQTAHEAPAVHPTHDKHDTHEHTHEPAPFAPPSNATFLDTLFSQMKPETISTGLNALDKATGGLPSQGLTIIGAPSAAGKTSLCLQIADSIAKRGQDVMIFTLEMSRRELIYKSLSRESTFGSKASGNPPIPANEIAQKHESASVQGALAAYSEYAQRVYMVEPTCTPSPEFVLNTVKKHIAATGNAPFVVIDYLQLLLPEDSYARSRLSDKQILDRSVAGLKRLCRECGVAVLAISSLNRNAYRQDIGMDSFKESGSIEYSSDLLLGLKATESLSGMDILVTVIKNRFGQAGAIGKLRFFGGYGVFE